VAVFLGACNVDSPDEELGFTSSSFIDLTGDGRLLGNSWISNRCSQAPVAGKLDLSTV